jgi:hypothetical protein
MSPLLSETAFRNAVLRYIDRSLGSNGGIKDGEQETTARFYVEGHEFKARARVVARDVLNEKPDARPLRAGEWTFSAKRTKANGDLELNTIGLTVEEVSKA